MNRTCSYQSATVIVEQLPNLHRFVWKRKYSKVLNYLSKDDKASKINKLDNLGRTALHYAASLGDLRMLRLLLTISGIEVNRRDSEGCTPFHKAVEIAKLECMKELVSNGANVSVPNFKSYLPLHTLILQHGDDAIECVRFIVESAASSPTLTNDQGVNSVHLAAMTNRQELLKYFLSKQYNVDVRDNKMRTPLMFAAQMNHPEVVDILLTNNANPHLQDLDGRDAMNYTKQNVVCKQIIEEHIRILAENVAANKKSHLPCIVSPRQYLQKNCEEQEQMSNLQSKWKTLHKENMDAEQCLDNLEKNNLTLQKECNELRNLLKTFDCPPNGSSDQSKAAATKTKNSHGFANSIKKSLSKKLKRPEGGVTQSEWRNEFFEVREKMTVLEKAMSNVSSMTKKHIDDHLELTNCTYKLQVEKEKYEKQLEKSKSALEEMHVRVGDKREKTAEIRSEKNGLTKLLGSIKEKFTKYVEATKQEKTSYHDELNALQEQLTQSSSSSDLGGSSPVVEDLERQVAENQKVIKTLRVDYSDLLGHLKEKRDQYNQLQEELNGMEIVELS